jgi:hypothetical protein
VLVSIATTGRAGGVWSRGFRSRAYSRRFGTPFRFGSASGWLVEADQANDCCQLKYPVDEAKELLEERELKKRADTVDPKFAEFPERKLWEI